MPDVKALPTKRIEIVDVLRGFSLLGIFLTHFFLLNLERRTVPMLRSDKVLEFFFRGFLFGRFYTIFSFLFGLSFAIQLQSALKRSTPFTGRFLWRLIILFVIGYLHFLFFEDDILQAYALLGIGLLLIRNLSVKQLLTTGAVLFLLLPVVSAASPVLKDFYVSNNAWNNLGSFCRKLSFYLYNKQLVIIALLFVLGLVAGRKNLFSGNHPVFSGKSYVIGIAIATLSSFAFAELNLHNDPALTHRIAAGFVAPIQQFAISYCYVATIVRLYQGPLQKTLGWLARIGKIGLTIYITQSVLLILATPLIVHVGLIEVVGIALLLFAAQIVVASWWVRQYRYGPLEWLWRSLTYMTIQPLRRSTTAETAALAEV